MNRRIGWIAATVLLAAQAGAQSPQRMLAVLELRGPKEMEPAVLQKLADEGRSGALDAVQSKGWILMTRENALALLTDNGKSECSEGECEVETARSIGADLVVSGEIVEIQGRTFLTLKLHEAARGSLLATEAVDAKDQLELVRLVRGAARKLVAKGLASEEEQAKAGAPLSFAGGIEVRVPKVSIAPGTASDLSQLNLRVETLLDAALDAEERPDAHADERAAAWCALAAERDRNPYQQRAEEACGQWRAHKEMARKVAAQLDADYATLSGYVLLKRIPAQQKVAAVDSFLKAYGSLSWHEKVRAVSSARAGIAVGSGEALPAQRDFVEPKSGLSFVRLVGGSYQQGCVSFDTDCRQDERAGAGKVSIEPFTMGRTEVTVDAYRRCVAAGACDLPGAAAECTWGGHGSHPITCVDWNQAARFCAWLGGRLPTASEWEFAARGGQEVIYPWGNEPATGAHANFCESNCDRRWSDDSQDDGWAQTAPVGSYPAGATASGLLDMAGNVWEWTSSNYDSSNKEIRGGGWNYQSTTLRASYRGRYGALNRYASVGFRCAL